MATEKKNSDRNFGDKQIFFLNFTAYINNEQDGAVGDTDALKGD